MKIKTDPSSVFEEFNKGLDYQVKMGFQKNWPELVNFVEGKQWPPATEKTKFMPRPVINQCDFIVENKKSNILSQNLKMVFNPAELPPDEQGQTALITAADEYTNAAESTWYDVDQNTLNEQAVDDALVIGTAAYHYFFDSSITGGQFTPFNGKIRGEIIDPIDIVVGNPHLYDHQTQQQPYIIIRGRMDIDVVKEIVKANGGNPEDIKPDDDTSDEKYSNAQKDMENERKVTVFTKYFKKNGAVYWIRSTKSVNVIKETSLAPITSPKPFTLYPIEIMVFKRRRKCTFGRSIIEDVIPSQKALNWQLGMMLLSVQQTAWPKLIAKVGALVAQVTNEPGEILTDNYGAPGVDGVKYMQPPNFTQMPMILTEKMLEMIRQTTGTTEVSSGEVMGANMAAAAIIALQNQAKKPNEAYQNKLYKSIKNIGRIWEEFFKIYYNQPKPIEYQDPHGNSISGVFDGSKSADVSFGLKVNVGPTSVFSESLQMSMLDMMAGKGWLNKYEYVKYAPTGLMPGELKHDFGLEYEKIKGSPPPPKDIPSVNINFADLPQDAQVQILQQMGIQSQGGPSDKLQIEQQKNVMDAHIKTAQSMGGKNEKPVR